MYNPRLHFHFVGIGGVGMAGLAEILLNLKFKVSGSDLQLNSACQRLKAAGAKIYQGHSGENVGADVSSLVYSSAVGMDNPEVEEAKRRGIPVIRRAEVLAELIRLKYGVAVAGSHGKTTTTSMIAHVLELANLDPTVVIGGQIHSLGSGAKLGKGEFLVAESDESDGSFLLLKPSIAVVTNIDNEHLGCYGQIEDLEAAFLRFVEGVPFYGLAVLCLDCPRVSKLVKIDRRKVTYGLSSDAEIRANNFSFDRNTTSFEVWRKSEKLFEINLPMPGRHLACNSLAAVCVGLELDISLSIIKAGLETFSGVRRRAEFLGEVHGISVLSDYGHHPTEIKATIEAVRDGWCKKSGSSLHVVFEPHRYSRTRDCFLDFLSSFNSADYLVTSEIYAASELPLPGVSGEILLEAINHPKKMFAAKLKETSSYLNNVKEGDTVLFLGAGGIGTVAEEYLHELRRRQ